MDELLDKKWSRRAGAFDEPVAEPASPDEGEATCACGSGIPVQNILIDGQTVAFLALPLILKQFRDAGKAPDDITARELLDAAKIYTPVPDGAGDAYAAAILRVYAALCAAQETAA